MNAVAVVKRLEMLCANLAAQRNAAQDIAAHMAADLEITRQVAEELRKRVQELEAKIPKENVPAQPPPIPQEPNTNT